MTLVARRRAIAAMLGLSTLVTVATSPVRPSGPALSAMHQTQVVLGGAGATAQARVTVRLAASQNGTGTADRGPLTGGFSMIALGCLAGPNPIDGGVTCVDAPDGGPPPSFSVTMQGVGAASGGQGAQAGSLSIFRGCPVGAACAQPITIDVALDSTETRRTLVELVLTASASGGTVNPGDPSALTITQP